MEKTAQIALGFLSCVYALSRTHVDCGNKYGATQGSPDLID